jgi:hypothetical protein
MIWLFIAAWIGTGLLSGQMLSYPGDGINMRHFLGAVIGPVALFVAFMELASSD